MLLRPREEDGGPEHAAGPVPAAAPFAFPPVARYRDTHSMGKRLRRVEEQGERVTVHFEDGTSASGDILVGADGVNSVGTFTF